MVVLDSRGRRYFAAGMEKTNAGFAGFASADFNIASGYLRRCAVLYDKSPRIGEVLYMLGAIRYHARADQEHWSDNFYLKEAIRRFPHTEPAGRCFDLLRREVSRAFTPQAIPEDLAEQLELYAGLSRVVAEPGSSG